MALVEALLQDCLAKLVALTAAFLALKFLIFLIKRKRAHETFKRMQIDGPQPHLISGHLYETRRQPYVQFAAKMHEQYGKNVGIYLGGDPFLLTKDLDLIQQVFVGKSRLFFDRMNFYLNIDPVPDNLICQRGERWRYMRKLLTPAFSNAKIRCSQFYFDVQRTFDKFQAQLEANKEQVAPTCPHKQPTTIVEDVYDRMAACALDVIVKTAFHMDDVILFELPLRRAANLAAAAAAKADCKETKRTLEASEDAFLETAKRACRLGFNPLVELIFCFPFLDTPLTFLCNHLYFGAIIRLLFDRLDYLVRRVKLPCKQVDQDDTNESIKYHHLNDEKEKEEDDNDDDDDDDDELLATSNKQTPRSNRRIIDSLIEVLRENKITKSEFTGNAFVIVFAGFETTANALTFTLYLLAKHQAVQERLRRELRAKLTNSAHLRNTGPDRGERWLEDELVELATGCEYLEMVINESLRLLPPVPGLSCRQASVDCSLSNGLLIERGVNVIPSVYSIHRDESIWGQDAHLFRPERFQFLDVNQLNSAMFMPFGLGPRNCIGKAAAMHELKILVGRLVSSYSIEPVDSRDSPDGLIHTPDELKICSPINITITNSEKIPLKFISVQQ